MEKSSHNGWWFLILIFFVILAIYGYFEKKQRQLSQPKVPLFPSRNSNSNPVKSSRQRSVSIKGEVGQESFHSLSSSVAPIAYSVKVTLENKGGNSITLDQIVSHFIPSNGKALTLRTFFAKGPSGLNYENYRKTPTGSITISAGGSKTWNFTTNGYTFDLLSDAGDEPLMFGISFLKDGKPVIRSFITSLPKEIQDLPSHDVGEKGEALRFHPTTIRQD